jgi:DNA-binding NarL/FixJ family response regulator
MRRRAGAADHDSTVGTSSSRLRAETVAAGERPLAPEVVGAGRSNQEIAAELFISLATVKSPVRRILAKLDPRDRAQAIVLAHECGLVADGAPR